MLIMKDPKPSNGMSSDWSGSVRECLRYVRIGKGAGEGPDLEGPDRPDKSGKVRIGTICLCVSPDNRDVRIGTFDMYIIFTYGGKVRIGTLCDKTTRGQMSGSGHILATEKSGSGRFEEEKGPDPL